jgi:hypothetical protein
VTCVCVQYGARGVALGESLRRRLPPPVHGTLLPRLLEAALPVVASVDTTSTPVASTVSSAVDTSAAATARAPTAAVELTQAERAALAPLLPPAPEASETALWCRTGGVRGGGALLHRLHVDVCRDHVRVASAIQTPE